MTPEEAMIGGLIHDVGKTILNNSMPESYAVIVDRVYDSGQPFIEVENEMLGFNHCHVGGLISRKWKLPLNLESVAEFHHATDFSQVHDQTYVNLCKVVNVADALCVALGVGVHAPKQGYAVNFSSIGLSPKRFAELEETFKMTYEEQKAHLLE
jgi:HD-like signal output (HDOD) protein